MGYFYFCDTNNCPLAQGTAIKFPSLVQHEAIIDYAWNGEPVLLEIVARFAPDREIQRRASPRRDADSVTDLVVAALSLAAGYCGLSCGEVGIILSVCSLSFNNSTDCMFGVRAREFQTLH
jgi:hypothetical protein